MTIDIIKLKALATAAAANQYDAVALNDYGTAVPPATVLGLIAEIERHRHINAEGCKPDSNFLPPTAPGAGATPCRSLDKAEGCKPDIKSPIHPNDMAAITKSHNEFLQLTDYGWPDDASALQDQAYTLGRTRGQNDWATEQRRVTPAALMLAMENLAVKASAANHPPVFLPASVRQVPLVILNGVCLRVCYSGLKWYHDQLIEDRWEPLSVDEFEGLLTDALRGAQGGSR